MKIIFLFLGLLIPFVKAKLQVGFYHSTCPSAEKIVQRVVRDQFRTDPTITAALLRMQFHDCFVRGCDASILIDPTSANPSEKSAGPNLSVRGYEIIDVAKQEVEAICPGVVSCADIITIATRDSVALSGGPKYVVATGRRDGLVSDPNLVQLVGPSIAVPDALAFFNEKGFDAKETVTLIGAHTVGVANCDSFSDRLSAFNGKPDPTMDPRMASNLAKICSGNNPSAFLDQSTWLEVDNEYYKQIVQKRGILQIDQEIALDNSTASIVSTFANNATAFRNSLSQVMVKLGNLDVIVGNEGEVRKNCRAFNS